MNLIDDQKQREREMVEQGIARFERSMEVAKSKDRHLSMAPYSGTLNEMTVVLLPHIKQLQEECSKRIKERMDGKSGRPNDVTIHLVALDPIVASYIIVRSILQESGCTHHTLASRVAGVLQMQRQFDLMKEEDNAAIERLKKTVKEVNQSAVKKWSKILDKITKVEWDWETRVKIGLQLMDIAFPALKDYVSIQTINKVSGRRTHWVTEVAFTPELAQRLIEEEHLLALESPWLTPMICPPKPFTQTESGGYLLIDHNIVKDNFYGVRVNKQAAIPQAVCDAVNGLGSVAWRINSRVLAVAQQAIQEGRKEILPVSPLQRLPEPIEDAVWAVMDKAQRGQHKSQRRMVHDHNNKLESKRQTMRRTVAVAENYKDFPAIYFPHNLDFRGRAYPLPQDLNPQGDDLTRSLLEFSEGKPTNSSSLGWTCHAVAAAYGEDKMSLIDQIVWCEEHDEQLRTVALDPLGAGYDFLKGAEEPWQFLAACVALEDAYEGKPCHLPVHLDGTCNGLQHLSAMGRDPVGAKAVNLMDGPRQDIYQDVADKVIACVESDTEQAATCWRGRITRKTVKRGVMTTPYGVTPEGIRRQLLDDGMLEGVPGDQLKNATYMRDRMVAAIDDTVVVGKQIMMWMQNVARQLCAEHKPVTWTTPIGFVCKQEYRKPRKREYYTLTGRASVLEPDATGELRPSKQVNSIAPNIVHSFDAAHLMMVVNRAREKGLSVGTVHDSYGTHACDVSTLGDILRDTFVEIYSHDQLENLKNSFIQCAGRYETWMEPPRVGDFDINEVRKSTYFFF